MLRQALRMFWRDWRSRELYLLMLAVSLAVTALSAVSFFADRLDNTLARDAHQLLGGDVVIVSDMPLPPEFLAQAQKLQLQTTHFVNFSSMAGSLEGRNNDVSVPAKMRLSNIKAVAPGYPLRGSLKVQASPDAPLRDVTQGPEQGEAWIAPELLSALGLRMGDMIVLGEARLPVTQLIVMEPDGRVSGLSMAPRVMLHVDDLPATELIQPASRARYRFAVAGKQDAVRKFDTWASQRIEGDASTEEPMRGMSMERLETGSPMMQQTLDRAQKFLHLVALLATLLSAVAVVIASKNFARRHLSTCAMLRVFGVSQKHIAFVYFVEFCLAGLLAAMAGIVLGYAFHYVFVGLLGDLLKVDLLPPSLWPVVYGVSAGLCLLFAFGLPPVLQLARVPPLRVLRRDRAQVQPLAFSVFLVSMLAFTALLLMMSADLLLGGVTVAGFALALLIFGVLSYFLGRLLKPLADASFMSLPFRLAIRSMMANPFNWVTQVSALGAGLLALLLLFLLRTDLLESWQELIPADASNRFVINVMPDQADAFQSALRKAGVVRYDWYPMILGRLSEVNGQLVNLAHYKNERTRRLVDREFNLSYMSQYPGHNTIIEGQWIAGERNGVSVEAGLMQDLGLRLGDALTFLVGGVEYSGQITSVRELEWSSMHVNFFVIFPLGEMLDAPQTYISAFKAPDDIRFDDVLAQEFPNITIINLSALLSQVQNILHQVMRAVEFIFIFTLLAGVLVLYTAIANTREQRTHDFAMMRALGADNQLLRSVQRLELMGTGAMAGLLASCLALAISGMLVVFVFDFPWRPTLWIPALGVVLGGALAWVAGWLSLRAVLQQPVMETLRDVMD